MARTTRSLTTRWGAAACASAAASLAFTPAQAATSGPVGSEPVATLGYTNAIHADFARGGPFDASTYDAQADTAEWRGRWGWGRRGWRRGWRGHRRGVRAGDVLAGVAIIGGIAAIASAANNRRRDRDVVVVREDRYERDREWQQEREIDDLRRQMEEQQRELDYLRSRGVSAERIPPSATARPLPQVAPPVQPERYGAPITIDTAIDRCVEVIEIDSAVSEVDGVNRTGTGWSITGRVAEGQSFTCRIDRNGQIEALENGRGFSSYSTTPTQRAAPGQWSGGQYADARAAMRGAPSASFADARGSQPLVPLSSDRIPAYPGRPLPGEDDGSIDGDIGG